jgi:hypothetical protein
VEGEGEGLGEGVYERYGLPVLPVSEVEDYARQFGVTWGV